MKTISRTPSPPDCLEQWSPAQDWRCFMGTACHAEVGNSLRGEQHHLCCYCESEITDDRSHIEHMEPRSSDSRRTYDYSNLTASCDGGMIEHCGRFKDDRKKNPSFRYEATQFCPPHDPSTHELFSYLSSGKIEPAPASNKAKAEYMIGYLGLDCPRLVGRRHAHAMNLIETLGASPDSALLEWAKEYYLKPGETGKLKQFHSLSKAILKP